MWERWKEGATLHQIARLFDRTHSSIHRILAETGGIRPPERCRSQLALTLAEREEISRAVVAGQSIRSIATLLGRAPSTISREIRRNGGQGCYRANHADQAAWDRARRPKTCKLAENRALARVVAGKLQCQWSPQQIAGWLKHTYPCDENYHVSHETIYRSLFLQARGALKKELLQHLRRTRGMRRSRHHTQKTDTHGRITDTVSIRDTRLNMRLAGMVFGLEMIFNLGRSLCETDDEGRRSFLALPGLAIMTTGSLGWLAGRALKAAVSRQREFLADARAVQFTRSKEGLGGVLRKVAGQQAAGGGTQRSLHPAVQHMLLVGASTEARWFASHPPLAERIRRIYGRPMIALPAQRDGEAVTRPDAIF